MSVVLPFVLIVATWALAFPLAAYAGSNIDADWPLPCILAFGCSGSVIAVVIS